MKNFCFNSSFADDVRHEIASPHGYEWWYFDAISDDGRDAVVIIFLDNFIFSPNYNKKTRQSVKGKDAAKEKKTLFPAIAMTFYRDGKPLYRAINEFRAEDFQASYDKPSCRIGKNRFEFEETPYGMRYFLHIEANLSGKSEIHAEFEWLAVESNFRPEKSSSVNAAHFWNLVAPRCDVTGKIEIFNRKKSLQKREQFRGTGYHDHNFDTRPMPFTVAEWQWGRAHFSDVTAVFYRYMEIGASETATRIFVIENEDLTVYHAEFAGNDFRRNLFGLRYPQKMFFSSTENTPIKLEVTQNKIIDASFFYLRMLGEARLTTADGAIRQTEILTENLCPKTLRWGFFDFLIKMRIGSAEKGAFLK